MTALPRLLLGASAALLIVACAGGEPSAADSGTAPPADVAAEAAAPAPAPASAFGLAGDPAACADLPQGIEDGTRLRDLGLTTCDGRPFALSSTCGGYEATLVNVEYGWCAFCKQQMPILIAQVQPLFGARLLHVVVLVEDEIYQPASAAYCARWASQWERDDLDVPLLVLMDPANTTRDLFLGVDGPSLSLLLDADQRTLKRLYQTNAVAIRAELEGMLGRAAEGPNKRPRIEAVRSFPERRPDQKWYVVDVEASDPDGDPLAYEFVVSGTFNPGFEDGPRSEQDGHRIAFPLDSLSDCCGSPYLVVSVSVTDGRGGEAVDYAEVVIDELLPGGGGAPPP